MKKLLLLAAVMLACGIGMGCNKSDDAKTDAPPSSGKMTPDKPADDKTTGDKAAPTDETLDKVKAALTDPKFKDVTPKHEDGKVKLTGKVADNETKKAAEKAVKDAGVTDPIMNMLLVEKH